MPRRVHHEPRHTVSLAPDTGPVEIPTPSVPATIALHAAVLAPGLVAVGMLTAYLLNGAP